MLRTLRELESMELMALIEDILIQTEKEKESVSQYGMMETSIMESIIRMNSMELLCANMQVEIAIGVRSNIIANMAMAHIIGLNMDTLTLGSSKMISKMAMVLIYGLMEKLIMDSIKMINGKDMDSASTRMATSMTAIGKMARDQAWQSKSTQQQESFKEYYVKMTSSSKL
jgi:hypothetical protein